MKPSRFSVFAAICRTGLAAAMVAPAFSVEVFFNNSSTDWTVLTGWNMAIDGTGGNPTIVPGASGATDYNVTFGVNSLTGLSSGRTVNIKGNRTIGLLKTINLNNIVTLTTGSTVSTDPTFRTLTLNGIEHTRGGITIGSTSDRQRINLSLLGATHTWNSATAGSSGTYTGNAIVVLNDVSPVSGSTNLILTGSNTGSRIDGKISGGISLIKRGTSNTTVWTLNGDNSFTGTVNIEQGIVKLGHGNAIPDPSKVRVYDEKVLSLLLVPTFTSAKINGFTSQTVYSSPTGSDPTKPGVLELDTSGSDASYDASVNSLLRLRKINGGELSLNGNGSFTGPIDINGGGLILRGNNSFSRTITINSGTRLTLDGNYTIATDIAVGANSLNLLGRATFSGAVGKATVAGGNLTIESPSTVVPGTGKPINVSGASSILIGVGTGGFSEAQFYDIEATLAPILNITSGTPSYGLSTVRGDVVWDGALRGAGSFAKGGVGTLTLVGSRTDTGPIIVREGGLRVFQLGNGGSASALGASTSAATSLTLNGGRLIYAGASSSTTDRLFTLNGNTVLEASGMGSIQYTNSGAVGGTGTRTLLLTGTNTGQNTLSAAGSGTINVTKQGAGTWWLSGAGIASSARVDSGMLVLDYATADPLSGNVTLNGGTLRLKGTGAATTKTIPQLTFAVSQTSGTHLKVSDGMQLTVTSLTGGGLAQRNDLIDLSGNPANSITVGGLAGNFGVVNGILMSNGGTSTNAGRASIALRAQDGTYGFPTLSNAAAGTGTIQKLTSLTEISPGSSIAVNSNTTNYLFKTSGTYSSTNNLVFGTMSFDSNSGPITLNMGTQLITPTGFGKAFLFQGTNNVTVSAAVGNTDAGDSSALWFHNYLQSPAKFLLSASLGDASQFAIFGGPGLTEYYGDNFVGNILVHNGVFRITKQQPLVQPYDPDPASAKGATFKASNGGVFEIGTKLIDIPESYDFDFAKPIGTGVGYVRLLGDSGFSAYREGGGTRIIQFSNKALNLLISFDPYYEAQSLSWGRGFFLTTPENENGDGEYSLKLSSIHSNATTEIRNTIDLNGKQRPVDVANGSAAVDAHLAGNLTGNAFSGLLKIGQGTLKLSGVNSYKGETRIAEGKIIADSISFDPESTLRIETGAQLELPTTDVGVAAVYVNGSRRYGTLASPIVVPGTILGSGKLYTTGTLTGYAAWLIEKNLETLTEPTEDYDKDGVLNLVEYATGSEPKVPGGSPLRVTAASATSRTIQFNQAANRTDLRSFVQSSPSLGAPWTTIATSTAGGLFSNNVSGVTVSTSAGTVSVTDTRSNTVMFYRVQYDLVD